MFHIYFHKCVEMRDVARNEKERRNKSSCLQELIWKPALLNPNNYDLLSYKRQLKLKGRNFPRDHFIDGLRLFTTEDKSFFKLRQELWGLVYKAVLAAVRFCRISRYNLSDPLLGRSGAISPKDDFNESHSIYVFNKERLSLAPVGYFEMSKEVTNELYNPDFSASNELRIKIEIEYSCIHGIT